MPRRRQSKTSQKSPSVGQIRIIGGLWRGRKLPVHDAEGLRPTSDRVKETLFNWLAAYVPQARCLDLFAGAGGLGFEAASRQAELVTMIELNPKAAAQLRQNAASLKTNSIEIVEADALAVLKEKPALPYDVIFIDPPFRKGLLDEVLNLLESNHWLSDQAAIYLECEKELELPTLPDAWNLHREKTAGQVCYRLFLKE